MGEFKITLTDLFLMLKRNRRAIKWAGIFLASLGFIYGITRPVVYVAEATFRDKGKAGGMKSMSLAESILTSLPEKHDSEAVSAMQSSRLMQTIIQTLGLNGSLNKESSSLERIQNNLIAEWADYNKVKTPLIASVREPIQLTAITYSDEVSKPLRLTFIDENTFEVDGLQGQLNTPFTTPTYSFTLIRTLDDPLSGRTFNATLFPLQQKADELKKLLKISPDTEDRYLIKIRYFDLDRHQAALFVNTLMEAYQDFLEEEHNRIAVTQLNYLKSREKEMAASLKQVMEEHAQNIQKDLSSSGFTHSQKEMEFITNQLLSINHKMMALEVEEKRLKNLLGNDFALTEQIAFINQADHPSLHEMSRKVRELRLSQDSLDLALKDLPPLDKRTFQGLMKEMSALSSCCDQLDTMIQTVQKGGKLDPKHPLMQDPKYLIGAWYETSARAPFVAYLQSLKKLFTMEKNTLQERVHHRQKGVDEYQGITLETAKEIYLQLAHDKLENERELKQIEFVLKQMEGPDFEISSLTSLLKDPIAQERIQKASLLSFALRDQVNRTSREQERTKEELQMHKEFLKTHLKESLKLLTLKDELLEDKNTALQQAMLDMSHREIALLEKQLQDYLSQSLSHIETEKNMLKDNQEALKGKLTFIPEKWIEEQLLEQHLLRNQKNVENVTAWVESKNINNNLELIQSAPLDFASTPLNPKPPRLFLTTLLGGVMGLLLASLFTIATSLIRKIPLSPLNLELNGFHPVGLLSYKRKDKKLPLFDQNLDTLRKAIALIERPAPYSVVLFPAAGLDFTDLLKELLLKQQKKVLTLSLTTDNGELGLKHYLEKSLEITPLIHDDTLFSGGLDRFSNELLSHPKFKALLKLLLKEYDVVLATTSAPLTSQEAFTLLSTFDSSLIGLTEETFQELRPLLSQIQTSSKAIGFLINEQLD